MPRSCLPWGGGVVMLSSLSRSRHTQMGCCPLCSLSRRDNLQSLLRAQNAAAPSATHRGVFAHRQASFLPKNVYVCVDIPHALGEACAPGIPLPGQDREVSIFPTTAFSEPHMLSKCTRDAVKPGHTFAHRRGLVITS